MKKLSFSTYLIVRGIPVKDLLNVFQHLSDASIAVILMNLETDDAHNQLSLLEDSKRNDVLKCLVDLDNVAESILNKIMVKIEKEIITILNRKYNQINTKETLAKLVCMCGTNQRSSMLGAIKDKKRSYYSLLNKKIIEYKKKNGIYFFEDLLDIDDKLIQMRISQVDIKTISIAIMDSPEIIKDKILENMSDRVRTMVLDDLKQLGEISKQQIETSQNKIMESLLQKR